MVNDGPSAVWTGLFSVADWIMSVLRLMIKRRNHGSYLSLSHRDCLSGLSYVDGCLSRTGASSCLCNIDCGRCRTALSSWCGDTLGNHWCAALYWGVALHWQVAIAGCSIGRSA